MQCPICCAKAMAHFNERLMALDLGLFYLSQHGIVLRHHQALLSGNPSGVPIPGVLKECSSSVIDHVGFYTVSK